MKRTALAAVLLAAVPARSQVVRTIGSAEALPIEAAGGFQSTLINAMAPMGLPPALSVSLLSAPAAPVPLGAPQGAPEIRPVPVYDRSKVSKKIAGEIAKRHAEITADDADPNAVRFGIPKTKAYVKGLVDKLLAASGLTQAGAGMAVTVNDRSWGDTGASMRAGVLTVEPEMIAIMSSEDEVAAVIAHEIVHYLRAHDEQLAASRGWSWPSLGGASRDMFDSAPRPSQKEIEQRWKHEYEADALSLRILVNAGYDPEAAVSALETIMKERDTEPRYAFDRGRPDPMHPTPANRVDYMRQVMAAEKMAPSKRAAGGLPEIYQELKTRRRDWKNPPAGDASAEELYQHYKRPKIFVP